MMDHSMARERESRCVQEQAPACTAACPVHLDVRGLIREIGNNNFTAAFAIFSRTIPFPRIISYVCDQPCRQACRRSEAGDAIQICALERACTAFSGAPVLKTHRLPQKNKRVAIVGSGLSGLTAAVDLVQKGYGVSLFEAQKHLGGRLRQFSEQELPISAIESDLTILRELAIDVRINMRVGDSPVSQMMVDVILAEYDAVLCATGLAKDTDGMTDNSRPNLFFSNQHAEQSYSPIRSLLNGRAAATTIDRFLQQASLTAGRELEGPYSTKLYTDMKDITPQAAVQMRNAISGYSAEEAAKEAGRCLQCECKECVKRCEFLAHYGSYPKRYVREIYNNDSIVMGMRHSNKMVNSCTLCGLCAKVCPVNFDMGQICHEAKQSMVEKGKMPPSAHEFALRDMEFCNSPAFFFARSQLGSESSRYLFFPGCQLCASSPDYVVRLYNYIREKTGSAGIMLGCCGSPADWAGRQELFSAVLEKLKLEWSSLGSPGVITACSTCYKVFREHLPDMLVESFWNWLDREGLPPGSQGDVGQGVAIHDPCTTREYPHIQDAIRSILNKIGVQSEELPMHGKMTSCCGFGGLVSFANPPLAEKIINRRADESSADYVAYCAMCRDNLARTGKRVFHILDFLFGNRQTVCPDRKGPDYSTRRFNRIKLKNRLLSEVWQEPSAVGEEERRLLIPAAVRDIMEQQMILEEDIKQVIRFYEMSGSAFFAAKTGYLIVHCRLANVTYWVEFLPEADDYSIKNVYSHRMVLTETAVCGEKAGPETEIRLICQKCEIPLTLGKVNVSYMDSAFPVELLKCQTCGAVYVPEELATGKMLEVEKAMEDK